MRPYSPRSVRALLLGALLIAPPLAQSAFAQQGRRLFVKHWPATPDDPAPGDGLGPMFNARSCAECHALGGIGGAGDNSHNVDLLCAVSPSRDVSPRKRRYVQEKLPAIHPGFQSGFNLVLHKFGTDPNYAAWRRALFAHPTRGEDNAVQELRIDGVRLQHSQRNTPALFGAGLIDAIPAEVLQRVARRQVSSPGRVSGRVPRTPSGGVGRFGWRGQVGSLRAFVLTACANELGLEVAHHAQAIDPLHPKAKAPGVDLTKQQCDALVAFVASLPAPRRLAPAGAAQAALLNNGQHLFHSVGCTDCHMPRLADASDIYSDLLLHDMGPGLADLAAALPERRFRVVGAVGGYSGGTILAEERSRTNLAQEWRTPPLWGVGDSAPYLHDGRARTLLAAIVAHGGEAAPSARRFAALPVNLRRRVLLFLTSLAAPGSS